MKIYNPHSGWSEIKENEDTLYRFYSFPDNKEQFLRKAISYAFDVKVDQLDANKSIARQPTDKTLEEVLQICLGKNTHYVMILRDDRNWGGTLYYHICARSMGNIDYFLWISVDVNKAKKLIKEFNLI